MSRDGVLDISAIDVMAIAFNLIVVSDTLPVIVDHVPLALVVT